LCSEEIAVLEEKLVASYLSPVKEYEVAPFFVKHEEVAKASQGAIPLPFLISLKRTGAKIRIWF
jgi:hypothetical protein